MQTYNEIDNYSIKYIQCTATIGFYRTHTVTKITTIRLKLLE